MMNGLLLEQLIHNIQTRPEGPQFSYPECAQGPVLLTAGTGAGGAAMAMTRGLGSTLLLCDLQPSA